MGQGQKEQTHATGGRVPAPYGTEPLSKERHHGRRSRPWIVWKPNHKNCVESRWQNWSCDLRPVIKIVCDSICPMFVYCPLDDVFFSMADMDMSHSLSSLPPLGEPPTVDLDLSLNSNYSASPGESPSANATVSLCAVYNYFVIKHLNSFYYYDAFIITETW